MRDFGTGAPVAPDAILGLSDDQVAHFMRDRVSSKSLHTTVKALNEDVLSGDPARRDVAMKALTRLGFV